MLELSIRSHAYPKFIYCVQKILLYFGAHWVNACNKFTPKLHLFSQLNSTNDNKEDFEIVFCSMDRNEAEYNKFAANMTWWCLPYAISTLPRLTAIYHAHGMPHLVVIDSKDGSTITKSGVDMLKDDPLGSNFPWRPTRVVDILPQEYIIAEDDDEAVYATSDLDEKYLLLYFASKSDSLSQEFTPWLVKAYNILKKQRPNDFEVSI